MAKLPFSIWFGLVWNALWFILTAYTAVASHSVLALGFMVCFAGLFLWSLRLARSWRALDKV